MVYWLSPRDVLKSLRMSLNLHNVLCKLFSDRIF